MRDIRAVLVLPYREGNDMPSWVAQPPSSPPELGQWDCEECGGSGYIWRRTNEESPQIVEEECAECDGRGRFDPEDNPYAPDNWKEAEGIA
jgi:hypothetical protein